MDIKEFQQKRNLINTQNVVNTFCFCHNSTYIAIANMEKNPTNVQNVVNACMIHQTLKDITEYTLQGKLTDLLIMANPSFAAQVSENIRKFIEVSHLMNVSNVVSSIHCHNLNTIIETKVEKNCTDVMIVANPYPLSRVLYHIREVTQEKNLTNVVDVRSPLSLALILDCIRKFVEVKNLINVLHVTNPFLRNIIVGDMRQFILERSLINTVNERSPLPAAHILDCIRKFIEVRNHTNVLHVVKCFLTALV